MKEEMDVVMKSVCCFLQRWLEKTGAEHTYLLLHTNVRWLRKGTFLMRFTDLLDHDFLKLSKLAEYA